MRGALFLLLTLSGCPSVADPPPSPDRSAQHMPPKSDAIPAQGAEAGFAKAFEAFRAYAAQHFAIAADQVTVVQSDEAGADAWKIPQGSQWLALKVGKAWAFESVKTGVPGPALRGYAVADGTIITLDQHLGRLFEEAGAWGGSMDMPALAARLIWAMGMGWSATPYQQPTFELDAAGVGKAIFFAQLRPPGPGSLQQSFQFTVSLTADHQASLARSENLNP